jgi:uroporphyrin-III C-methyltransferase
VTSFAVVTGHEDPTKPESSTDWAALARIPTLIILMAVKHIADICAELVQAGRAEDTPAAAISWATTDYQRVLRTTLGELPEAIESHKLPTPAVIVIGDVAALSDQLAWFQPQGDASGFAPMEEPL